MNREPAAFGSLHSKGLWERSPEAAVAEMKIWDAIVVGAGPAGLSAALVLGRCCRKVLLCDRGTPRNRASHAVYGFISRDGMDPAELRHISLAQLERYPLVQFRPDEVVHGRRTGEREFTVRFASGAEERA